jgi:hypothetical protein
VKIHKMEILVTFGEVTQHFDSSQTERFLEKNVTYIYEYIIFLDVSVSSSTSMK